MKLVLFLILGLFISQSLFAASAQVNNIVGFSGTSANNQQIIIPYGQVETSLIVTICGGTDGSVSSDYYGFYSQTAPGSSAQYQVPGGKVFYGLYATVTANAAFVGAVLGYGTAALAAEPTATPPTGSVMYGANVNMGFLENATATNQTYSIAGVNFPSSSFPYWRPNTSSNAQRICLIGKVN